MADPKPFIAVWDALKHLAEPYVPGAIGAAIGQAWEPGLGWRQRVIQWFVGLTCAVFLVPAIAHVCGWGDPLTDAVSFVVGTLAFKAVPALREAFIDGGSGALRSLPEVFRSWVRKPGSPPEGDGQ